MSGSTLVERPAAPRDSWEARYFDGQTAARRPARVRPLRIGLEVCPEGAEPRVWPYAELRQTQGFYRGEPVRLERDGVLPEAIVVHSLPFLAALRAAAPDAAGRFHDPTRRRLRGRLTLLAAAGAILLTGGVYLWGLPALAALAAARVPVAWEDRLGASVAAQLAPAGRRCDSREGRLALDALVARLAGTVPDSPYRFQVIVLDVPAVNAFATPGGRLLLLRGLLAGAKTPEELAGVLAHEMQHVLRRHATKAIIQHASSGLLLTALTGDASGALAFGLEGARTLAMLEYSRQHEDEADAEGLRMLQAARIDPAGMLHFLESTRTSEGAGRSRPRYLSTHPDTTERIARLRGLLPGPPAAVTPALDPERWAALRGICGTPTRPH
jgi:beta-barrel assembly-enhancing protease